MKKFFFILIVLFISTQSFAQDTLKMVYFDNFLPSSWMENGQMQGILIDVSNEIFNRLNISVTHRGYPWARAQLYVKVGEADAFISVPTPERRTYTEISKEPVIFLTVSLFTKAGNPKIEQLKKVKKVSDLSAFKIVGYIGDGWGKNNLKGMRVQWVPKLDQALSMLKIGRADVLVQSTQVVQYTIKKMGLSDQIVEVSDPLVSVPMHFCIGKKSPFRNRLSQIDETIRQMKRDGVMLKITGAYH